jgi:hypothetical protein
VGRATASGLGDCLFKTRFLDATGVLVGQSSGIMYAKSSKSGLRRSKAMHPVPGTVPGSKGQQVSDDFQSYALTKVFRQTVVKLRYVQWARVNTIVVGDAVFPWSLGDTQRILVKSPPADNDRVEPPRKHTWYW